MLGYTLRLRTLGLEPYESVWHRMRDFTNQRNTDTLDECWLLEHIPVFTQGQAGKAEHLLDPGDIPVIYSDRGGQVTYHGPGQWVVYLLIDLKRKNLGIKTLVRALEDSLIALLADYNIPANTIANAPGVYVKHRKIASLGLKVRRGCTYHGLSLNVAMDLKPFERIHPCGYPELKITQMRDFMDSIEPAEVGPPLIRHLMEHLGYTTVL
jgi:lipoyl(octanoyl) transferase